MRRDHSDADMVNALLARDQERQPRPVHWLVPAILGGWFAVILTVALFIRAWEVVHGR